MTILLSALVLGIMGSFHCAGMCGPIAVALPLHGNTILQKFFGGTLYNLGRTLNLRNFGGVVRNARTGNSFAGFSTENFGCDGCADDYFGFISCSFPQPV